MERVILSKSSSPTSSHAFYANHSYKLKDVLAGKSCTTGWEVFIVNGEITGDIRDEYGLMMKACNSHRILRMLLNSRRELR